MILEVLENQYYFNMIAVSNQSCQSINMQNCEQIFLNNLTFDEDKAQRIKPIENCPFCRTVADVNQARSRVMTKQ